MLSVHIKKSFRNFLLDISFEAKDETLALLGASGCGKSMTLKCIAGVIKPDSGVIILNGRTLFDSQKKINLPPQKRKTGLLFQNYALFPNMTVEENIAAGLRRTSFCAKNSKIEHKKRIDELLETFYLSKQRRHYPAQLSGGQEQRAALARIIASEPEVLMLDEPLSALDSFLRWQLEYKLLELIEKFCGTTLYVSHNRDEVFRLAKKVCVISNGKNEPPIHVKEFFIDPKTKSAALLSGCKNFSRAKKIDSNHIFATDWNCELLCKYVPDDIQDIGIRAHSFMLANMLQRAVDGSAADDGDAAQNKIDCVIKKIIPDLFGTIIIAAPKTNPLCELRIEKSKETANLREQKLRAGCEIQVCISPADILMMC